MTASPRVIIGLSAVVVAAGAKGPEVLLSGGQPAIGLPFGSFDPVGHRTFELAVRDFVTAQTGFALGYVEQLYTFGDKGREAPVADMGLSTDGDRIVSVGYIALAGSIIDGQRRAGIWADWYRFLPWEDQRTMSGTRAVQAIIAALSSWATTPERQNRVALAFGLNGLSWNESHVLERYELLYEAGLVQEAARDRAKSNPSFIPMTTTDYAGEAMVSDHRRILATAMGRLRAKIRYRPIVFDLAPQRFTLSMLQDLVEALCGVPLHKQNFRRTLERSGLVVSTGAMETQTGGRPAMLFTKHDSIQHAGTTGLALPLAKR
ncbi:NUDIX hydrolase [Candidatus Phycosocius spiralis]|uniref:NAD regulator n=1 Tax=Candidatus Phycosocius spiralis TaxID=2815099 RepID=A0ABQ4PSX7_9PROT|nr:NAD regulator [Candidatus Phycosocius spiralis]GIU66068.1 NAD regulator [Candidatus Phycosocius spiralis]